MSINSKQNTNFTIESIQRVLLYVLVAILPISILPFPWDLTEKGMSIAVLVFAVLILALEIIKIIWTGKFLFLKRGFDLIIFSLLISYILTTVFSSDSNLSLFGFNYRFSAGLIGLGSVLLLTFLTRSFLSSKKDILNLITAFLVGSILTSFFSVISLFGGNILSAIPQISSLARVGFPIIGTSTVLVIYNCIAILLARISFEIFKENGIGDCSWFSSIAIIVNVVSLLLFSIDTTALITAVIFLVLWIVVSIIILGKEGVSKTKNKILSLILPLSILVSTLLMQITGIYEFIFKNTEPLSQLSLSINFSWQIVAQSLMVSLKNGIVGVGLDSFATSFTALKPIVLSSIDMTNGFNEILTSLSNSGFLWLVIWLILGWFILKDLITDLRKYTKETKILVLFDVLSLFIYISSFLTTYTVVLRFAFFLVISMSIVIRSILSNVDVDRLLLKVWAIGTNQKENKGASAILIFLTSLVSIVAILILIRLGSVTLSSLYLLRAKNHTIEKEIEYSETELSLEQKEEFVDQVYYWYGKALRYDKNNPVTNREFSLIAVDKMDVTFAKYNENEEEELLNSIVLLRNQAFEYSKTAINLSPSTYANYNNRALIYLGLVNLGYSDYIRDAISAINDALVLKPLDYQGYYHKAQLFYLLQDYESALSSSTESLGINGSYIPSLILSANIYGVQGKTEIQLSYLDAIKIILEKNDQQEGQLYKDLLDQIDLVTNPKEATSQESDNEASPETEL